MDISCVYSQLLRNVLIASVGVVATIELSVPCKGKDPNAVITDAGTPVESTMKREAWQQLQPREPRFFPPPATLGSSRFERMNLEVLVPGTPWERVDTGGKSPNLCVCMARLNPNMLLMLAAESVGVELNPEPQLLAKLSKARLLKLSPQAVFANEKEETVAGVRGRSFEASMISVDGPKYWLVWVGSRNGYCYELAVVGNPYNAQEVNETRRDFCRGLRQIDPQRVAHTAPSEIFTKYKSKAFGYDIDLTGAGWVKMRMAASQIPAAEICLESQNGTGLIVLAVPMPNRVPDMDILAKTVVGADVESGGTEIVRSTPYQFGDLQCREIETSRMFDGKKVEGRMRLIADERCAYAVFGWSLSEYKGEAKRVRKAIDEFGVRPHMTINTANLTPSQRACCANLLNAIGFGYYKNGDLVGSLDFFESSIKFSPTDETCVCNYLEVLAKLDRNDEALRFLDKHKSTYGNNVRLRVLKARMLAKKGDVSGSRRAYGELIDDGYVDDGLVTAYVDVAIASKAYDEAIVRVAKVIEKRPAIQVLRLHAGLYTLKGDHDQAIKMFEKLRAEHPDDIGVAVDLAAAYEQAEQFDAAIELTQKLIESGHQDEPLLLAHGRVLTQQGRMVEAKRVIERARDLYPSSERISEALKIVSSHLGEGENSCLKKSIDPVATPTAVRKAIDQADQKAATMAQGADAEELLSVVGVNYRQGQPIRTTTTQRIKVYTAGGVARYGMLTYKLNPVAERLYVNRLVVTDENGKRVAEGAVDSYFVSDDASGQASNSRTARIPVPGLKPGYTLEAIVTRESLAIAKELPFQEVSLSCESPARVSAYFLTGDTKELKCKATAGVQVVTSTGLFYAVESDVAPIRYEPQQPSVETFAPVVWVAATKTTWADEGCSYLKLIEDKLVLDDATKRLAGELTRDCKTKREKLAAIAQHVQQGYTYHAIEFGQRAMIPNSAAKTVALKYGDCKDHALLTQQLLTAVDITAYLAVVRSSGDIVADMPSLDQFDHAVVFVPDDQFGEQRNSMGGLVIDATSKSADPLLDVPWGLDDRSILVLDPATPHLVRTPKYPADAGRLISKRNVTLEISKSGSVESRVSEDVTLNAYLAPGIRGFFRHSDSAARREAIQSLLSDNGPIRVKSVEPVNLEAVGEPLRIHLEYSVPNSFRMTNSSAGGKTLVGSLPCAWETQYALAAPVDSRRTPFAVAMPRVIESTLTIQLPPGYSFSDMEQFSSSGSSKYRVWSSHASEADGTVTIEYRVCLLAGRFPAKAYEQFYSESNDSLAALRAPLTLHNDAELGTARRPAKQSGDVR